VEANTLLVESLLYVWYSLRYASCYTLAQQYAFLHRNRKNRNQNQNRSQSQSQTRILTPQAAIARPSGTTPTATSPRTPHRVPLGRTRDRRESLDSNEAYDENGRDAPNSAANTHTAPEPGPGPEEDADRLVHLDNFHSAAATRFDGYASSDVASERGQGGRESESESRDDSVATVRGGNGNGPSPMGGSAYSRYRTFRHKQSGTTDSDSELPGFEGDDSDEYSASILVRRRTWGMRMILTRTSLTKMI
jgi:hypothetical protein